MHTLVHHGLIAVQPDGTYGIPGERLGTYISGLADRIAAGHMLLFAVPSLTTTVPISAAENAKTTPKANRLEKPVRQG